ncbi:YHS domain-containing (seleno)protein [Parendozoicomonas sp. Alg238-R29]|uniref:YHS domain-containing (seleno)protein n=1 Tax=Parendozoicomonas sp. Alg238-R29 TaxID=2993446 RepID=UPI00248EBB75|nr:YHS domain-containing (seleno)protein [Parendozoicomonas sp. Alg238-R29]
MILFGWKSSLLAFVLVFTGFFGGANAATSEYYTTFMGNAAVGGFDTVAYFTMGKAVKGKRKYSWEWSGVNWRFVSEEHREMFKANPEKYAPKYGGHCAWAVSEKSMLYRGSPQHWKIIDGELYLNHNPSINKRWMKNYEGHIDKANKAWPELKEKYMH